MGKSNGANMNDAFLTGNTVYLRSLRDEDAFGDYVGWLNNPEVCKYNSHHVFPYNKKKALAFIESTHTETDRIVLAVCIKENDQHIGNISLQKIDLISRNAEFAILLGNMRYWGKGVGTEASMLLLEHGFRELNFHRIGCGTSSDNIGMQKLAMSLGMKEEGRRRESLFKHGVYVDMIDYGILEKEFFDRFRAGTGMHGKENTRVE
jgi:ribosomal-protein-alanine N-acetyltransferase